MNELLKEKIKIENMIYEIRGKQVMLDSDVAHLYDSETKIINQVKTMHGGMRYLPYAFTEHGVMMLSRLLKSDIAAKVNIKIIHVFVMMRKYMSNNLMNLNNHSNMLINHENRIKVLEQTFSKFDSFSNELFFEGAGEYTIYKGIEVESY